MEMNPATIIMSKTGRRERRLSEEMDRILCDELLEEVLRRLPPRTTFSPSIADVSLVSKRWLRLYRSSKSRILLRVSSDNCTPSSLSSFLLHFPHLFFLNVACPADDDVSDFSDQILLSVASSCPKLTTLLLRGQPVSLSSLLPLSTSCPRLTSLGVALSAPLSFHWLLSLHSLRRLAVFFLPPPVTSELEPLDAASKGEYCDAELQIENKSSICLKRFGSWFNIKLK